MEMPPQPQTDLPEDAVTLLTRTVDESPSAPTIVALGPWTNLEDLVTRATRRSPTGSPAIHAMGGAVDVPGNVIVGDVTAEDGLEWNLAADPSAVSAVFATATPISLVPLDATNDVPIPPDLAERLAEDHEAAGADLVYELLQRVPTRLTGEGQQLWDELAALTVEHAGPRDVGGRRSLLADNAGRVTRHEAGRPVRIATGADREAVESALLDALRVGAARATPFTLAGTAHGPLGRLDLRDRDRRGPHAGRGRAHVRERHRRPGRRPDRGRAGAAHVGRSWRTCSRRSTSETARRLPDWVIEAGGVVRRDRRGRLDQRLGARSRPGPTGRSA